MNTQPTTTTSTPNDEAFRDGVMPRAQLSIEASRLAVEKATQKNAKEFAGFELEEAIAVVQVLEDMGTARAPQNEEAAAFIKKLHSVSGKDFDQQYMEAELTNHEFLRDLTKSYLEGDNASASASHKQTKQLAIIATFAFHEHVALCKRIYGEVTAE